MSHECEQICARQKRNNLLTVNNKNSFDDYDKKKYPTTTVKLQIQFVSKDERGAFTM